MTSLRAKLSSLRPLMFVHQLAPAQARLATVAFAALLSLALLLLLQSPLLIMEERLGALGWTMAPDRLPEDRLTLVTIDERSLAEVGPWPWSRQQIAELVSAIDAAGAQLQLHDIVYPEARAGDAELLQSIANAEGGVLMAQVPVLTASADAAEVRTGELSHAVSGVSCAAQPSGLPAATQFLAPHSGFAGVPKGHITPLIADDGAVRKTPALICVEGEAYPALGLAAFLASNRNDDWAVRLESGDSWLQAPYVLRLDAYPGLDVPLDRQGAMRISFASDPGVYRAISAIDVLKGTADLSALENTWVLVGGTAFGMADIVPTPYDGATAGVELQARILTSLLDVAVPYTPQAAPWLLGLSALVFAVILYALAVAGGRVCAYGLPLAAAVLPVLSLLLHAQLLQQLQLWLGWIYPALFGLSCALSLLLLEQSRIRVERSRVYSHLNSYLPQDVAREIAYALPSSSINAERRDVTLLSADLRNFSAFGESRPPEESAAVLHFFFTRATAIIEQHKGRVLEFKGDNILAVWDNDDAASARLAFAAADTMATALDSVLPEHTLHGVEPLGIGIGIEQGSVLIGSIGPAHRRTHTLLGDTVSITLRIQEMTAELAQPILVGERAARSLVDQQLESQGSYLLSGLRNPHQLFALAPTQLLRPDTDAGRRKQPDLRVFKGGLN